MNATLRIAVTILICVMLISYLGTYLFLRNRGLREVAKYETDGLLYESFEVIDRSHDLKNHFFRARLFAPLNLIDQHIFGGPPPVLCMMFELD